MLHQGLELAAGVTMLVRENGSGKSTVIELLAEANRLNPQGGLQSARYQGRDSEPGIGAGLKVFAGAAQGGLGVGSPGQTPCTGFTATSKPTPAPTARVAEPKYHEMSHGEGFLEMLARKVNEPGFYLLDEPDPPLPFTAFLALLTIVCDLAGHGSQLVIATHSPILAAPGRNDSGSWRVGLRPTTCTSPNWSTPGRLSDRTRQVSAPAVRVR